ncbi:MAG: trypsin-like peptidase domain-containing protein [Phycisphaeraceae bacterium]|nr:trypsin-like peptidase domain-containing protein [Phycisphaeraceae bacterium]
MRRFIAFGPALVVLITTLVTLVAAPAAVRMVGYAATDAQIRLAQQTLESDDILVRMDRAVRAIADSVEPSVVHIGVDQAVGGGRFVRQSQGSGWVYDNQGHIVTNAHVIRGASRISVQFQDGRTVNAQVVGFDQSTDVAVIRAQTSEGLYPARRATGDSVYQGDRVFAFGSPFGFKFSMSEGIVSGLGRDPRTVIGYNGYTNFIQTDAAVNPGNSGGPLVDTQGRVIGMNVAIATGARAGNPNEGQSAGISFHIPLSTIEAVAAQLIAGQPLAKGFMGINLPLDQERPNDPEASERLNRRLLEQLGYRGQGVVIVGVEPRGPAGQAGLKPDDVITSIAGQRVLNIAAARAMIANTAPGEQMPLEVWRAGETRRVTVTLGVRPPNEADLGTMLRELERFGLGDLVVADDAVVVRAVPRNSAADRAGFRGGQTIMSVEGQPVKGVFDLLAGLATAGLGQGRPVVVRIIGTDGEEREARVSAVR